MFLTFMSITHALLATAFIAEIALSVGHFLLGDWQQ
jgi:hypothetical protein